MYYTVPGENRVGRLTRRAIFTLLIMVLLCLWMGKKEFKEKREFELMKRKFAGDLPFPSDLYGTNAAINKSIYRTSAGKTLWICRNHWLTWVEDVFR